MRGALYREADPVARGGVTGPPCRPQEGRPAPLAGPLACRPWGGRQGPVAPQRATGPSLFFLQGLRCKFEEKKNYI